MILVCPNCATRYVVPDSAIGVSGRQVRCASCHHSWFQQGPELELPATAIPDAAAPAPAPAPTGAEPPPSPPEPVAEPEPQPVAQTPAAQEPDTVPADDRWAAQAEPAPAYEAPMAEEADPVAQVDEAYDEPAAAATPAATSSGKPAYYFDDVGLPTADPEEQSPFAPQPPFRPRRNLAKLWTGIAVGFFLIVSAAGAALWYFGPPAWAVNMGLVADSGDPDLLLNMPRLPERRKLPSGREYFSFSGQIVNGSDREVAVPPILVELRDLQNRRVFEWTMKPPVARLKPGQQAGFSESRLDIPKNAKRLTLTFVEPGN